MFPTDDKELLMKTLKHYAAFVAGSIMLLLAVRCTNMNPANTSEVGNPKLTGHLVDGRTGTAAEGAIVRVYPVYLNKMAKALGKVATDAPAIDSMSTDHNGAYQFDSLANGIYSVEGEKIDSTDTLTMRHSSVVFVASEDLGYDTLQLPGSIKGKVVVPNGESAKNITCYIPGTSYIAITNDTGGFRITGIPAGTYSLSTTSTKFNDTTIYGIKVTPNHETNAGYILLGLDRSKNEHDVWGVFDTTYNCKPIDSIEARVSGDSIPANSPRIYKLDWRPALSGYSGFIYVPDGGFFWTVDVWVFDSLGRRIGAYRVQSINRATGDVLVPNFNPFNSIPVITLHDTTVSINDTIRLHAVISTLTDDSIVSMAWKIGSAGTFTNTTKKDTIITAPKDSGIITCMFKVTDKFGNTATDTINDTVITDSPIFSLGNDTTISVGANLTFSANIQQRFGTVVMYTWSYQGDTTWTDSGSQHTKSISFNHSGQMILICKVRDDDGNVTVDTVNITVVTEIGGVISSDMTLRESGSPYRTNNLIVLAGVRLTIEPGVTVYNGMNIHGTLDAEGTNAKRIIFSGTDIEGFPNASFKFKYCDISGVQINTFPVGGMDTISIDSCIIQIDQIYVSNAVGLIRGCVLSVTGSFIDLGGDHWIVEGNKIDVQGTNTWGFIVEGNSAIITSNVITGGGGIKSGSGGIVSFNNISGGGGIESNADTIVNNTIESCLYMAGGALHTGGALLVANNTVINSGCWGIVCDAVIPLIYNNTVMGSTSFGIIANNGGIIRHNSVTGNGFGASPGEPPYFNSGILCMNSSCTIDSNIITGNSTGAMCHSGCTFTNNNIHDNQDYNFRVLFGDSSDVNVANNWWGTTDTVQIRTTIFDSSTNPVLRRAIIDPIAPSAIIGAGAQ
jgi:hypothetical protein